MKLIALIFFILFSHSLYAQISGRWEGNVAIGRQSLLLVFNLTNEANGKMTARMDIPAQGAKDLVCDDATIVGDSLFISIKLIGGRYAGRFNADRSATTGTFKQGSFSGALNLQRTGEVKAVVLPQTPKPPFPYASEDVDYDNQTKSVHLAATLTKPQGRGPFPVAILITGSGPQDRDGTLFGHKPFWVIADYLTRRGIAVLRVDDRGMGKSTGSLKGTSADFAQDVLTSLDFLKTRKDIDPKKMGLIGHSEGGMIAPIVATQRPNDVAFIISLAGPGEKIIDLMTQQNVAVMTSAGAAPPVAENYGMFMRALINVAITEPDTVKAYQKAAVAFSDWRKTLEPTPDQRKNLDPAIVAAAIAQLTGMANDAMMDKYVRAMILIFQQPWNRYFFAYDPLQNLTKLTCPVLALNGEKDNQVLAKPNLAGWESALTQGKNKKHAVREMAGLNHLFQHCQTCTVTEYGELTETFAPEVLQLMSDWLTTEVLH